MTDLQQLYRERETLEALAEHDELTVEQADRLAHLDDEIDDLEVDYMNDAREEREMYPERFEDSPSLDPHPFDGRSYPEGY